MTVMAAAPLRPGWAGSAGVLVVVAVVVGLIGMHGLASGEMGGCHGGMATAPTPAPAPMVMTPPAPDLAADTMSAALARPAGHSTAGVLAGSVCQSEPPPGWPGVAGLLALVLVLLGGIPGWCSPGPGWTWQGVAGRAPPRSGVTRLRWVCVSRM
jgi:hypothetical protein